MFILWKCNGPYLSRNCRQVQKDVQGRIRGDYSDTEAWEATHNLLGVFDWLLKQDMKQNPHLYKKTNSDEQGGVNMLSKSDKIIKE